MLLLTHGYFIAEDKKEQQMMKPYPPLGLLYISAYLKEKNIHNTLFDSTFSNKQKLKDFLLKNRPEIVAFYTNIVTKLNVLELITFIKSQKSLKNTKIILGGPDITYNVENYLNHADFLVIGEGEETMYQLVTALTNNTSYHDISGIAFSKNGKTILTPVRQKINDLGQLPLPNRGVIDTQKYLDVWKKHHGKSTISVSTQRGCPYTCKWYSTAVYGQSYRRRPAKKVVAELALLRKKYNPDAIWFVDDVFTVSHKWLRDFHTETIKQKTVIPFECITRAERLNDDILQLLKEAGCFRIWIGAESGSQRIIDKMNRRVNVKTVREIIKKANKIGLETGTFIMVGYPTETEKDIFETVRHLKESNPTHFTITVAYPIKGTGLYAETEKDFTKKLDWQSSTDRDIDFKRHYPRKYYNFAMRYIVNEVNFYKEKRRGIKMNIRKAVTLKIKSIAARILMSLSKSI